MMKNKTLRFRQVHLDFHTSPLIEDIGASFDPHIWKETLQRSHVDSITCFSKCHHGLSYHPTEVGKTHPNLKFDLLRAQINACSEIDIKVPIYLSAGLDNAVTETHPEWREITSEGRYAGWAVSPLEPGFHKLCFNTPYLEYLCCQIREVCRIFPEADGIFLDIINQGPCCCSWCRRSMTVEGFDATKEEDRKRHAKLVLDRYFQETNAAAHGLNSDMPIFHNSGNVNRGDRADVAYQTHLELESLPTGGWGYDHFPESASYVAHLGKEYLGMTGKFHLSWGEFGGFKHPNALRYECAAMLAFGAKCSVGDQLHPTGQLDSSTYGLIESAYREVDVKSTWCVGSSPVCDVGVLSSEAVMGRRNHQANSVDTGACRVLLEGHHLFALLDAESDFAPYKLLILPDDIRIGPALKRKLDVYLSDGGRLLLTGLSGIGENGFAFDIGARHEGESTFSPDYILPAEGFGADFVKTPMVMYLRSQRIKVEAGGFSLGEVFDPYFDRDYRHFSSHRQTPNRPTPSGYSSGVLKDNIAYLAHPVFTIYAGYGAVAYREYILRVIGALLGESRTLRSQLPSQARVTMTRQAAFKRYVLHFLYANKHLRGGRFGVGPSVSPADQVEIIEELETLPMSPVSIFGLEGVNRITIEPQGREVAFEHVDSTLKFNVPEFSCHQMVVLHQ